VLLPLLVINALLPLLYDEELIKKGFKSYLIKFILPLFAVLAIVFLWQKAVGPYFFTFSSRLNFQWKFVIPSFLSWLNIFGIVQINPLLQSIVYLMTLAWLGMQMFGFVKKQLNKKS